MFTGYAGERTRIQAGTRQIKTRTATVGFMLLSIFLSRPAGSATKTGAGSAITGKHITDCELPDKFKHHPKLKDKENKLLLDVIAKAESYGDCNKTISCCLAEKQPSRFAERLWWAAARMAATGFKQNEILEELKRRKTSFENPVKQIDLKDRPVLGSPKAPVIVVEFSEFECPYCRQTAVVLKGIIENFSPDQVALGYKFFPISKLHPFALGAARFGVQAFREGKFWEVYKRLTSKPPDLKPKALAKLAKQLGMKGTGLDDPSTLEPIDHDVKEGNKLGIDGVPAVYINGREYVAFRDPASLTERLFEELDRLGLKVKPSMKAKERRANKEGKK
ncbi:MAG: thioredoxin domain-containing protein [Deltaproteobacteria bacterium]|nr:thioredoxin domain-containing protein [Deltaproteobacteria bacterium]